LTLREMAEELAVRATLEGLAAREAHGKLTPGELAQMAVVLEEMRAAGPARKWDKYFAAHRRFHEIFISACHNHLLTDLLSFPRMDREWYPPAEEYHRPHLREILAVHQEILKKFLSPKADPLELSRLVRDHIVAARERCLVHLGGREQENLTGYALQ
jgi:DNA-binding GntR family transcriptional regulator